MHQARQLKSFLSIKSNPKKLFVRSNESLYPSKRFYTLLSTQRRNSGCNVCDGNTRTRMRIGAGNGNGNGIIQSIDQLHNDHFKNRRSIRSTRNISHTSPNSNNGGGGGSIVLFDSLSGKYQPVTPLPQYQDNDNNDTDGNANDPSLPVTPKGLAWYTCGPTVYDSAHLGHARTYVTIDIIQRALLYHHNHLLISYIQNSRDQNHHTNHPPPPPPNIYNEYY